MEKPQSAIPYQSKPYKIAQSTQRIHSKEGVVIPVDPYAWLCDGPLKKIEEGLPLIVETPYARSYDDAIHADKKIKALQMECLKTFFSEEELKESAPIERQVPVETHDERNMRMLMEKIVNKERKKLENPHTGIVAGQPSKDLVASIGKVHIQSVTKISKKPPEISPFPRPCHPKPRSKTRPKSTVALVRNQLQRVFRPGLEPFTNVDSEDDFPIDDIIPQDGPGTEEEEEKDPNEEEAIDYNKIDYPTKLIDQSDKEIFWTKDNAPFTKAEVDMLYSWRKQDEDFMHERDQRGARMFKRREMAIKRTFQSKLAFRHELALVNRVCQNVTTLGPGKVARSKESTWSTAARAAKHDISSLPYRKARWMAFVKFVKDSGGMKTELQKKFAQQYREHLLAGKAANNLMLWDLLNAFEEMNFTVMPLLVYVEFVRTNLGVSRNEMTEYFNHRNIPKYFYDLAVKEMADGNPFKLRAQTSSVSKSRVSSRIVVPNVQV